MGEDKYFSEEATTEEGNGTLKADKEKLGRFLGYPEDKRKYQNFVAQTFMEYESENVQRLIDRVQSEHKSELRGSKPHYKPGHIGPLVYEHLNMMGVENAFVSGIQHTKSSMVKTVQQRVDDINTLLRGVGGFNRQIKPSFSRSAVVYLEKDHPKNNHSEIVIFSINLPTYELKRGFTKTKETEAGEEELKDERDDNRLTWDYAVNVLSEIVSNTGLKPKYVKNDKNRFHLEMHQKLLEQNEPWPDEYFIFTLDNMEKEALVNKTEEYEAKLAEFDEKLAAVKKSSNGWGGNRKKAQVQDELYQLEEDRTFFIATTPDPKEIDPGLLFEIKISTCKDYSITKDKMQVIMTKYILALSKIAVDKTMDEQLMADYARGSEFSEGYEADASSQVDASVT